MAQDLRKTSRYFSSITPKTFKPIWNYFKLSVAPSLGPRASKYFDSLVEKYDDNITTTDVINQMATGDADLGPEDLINCRQFVQMAAMSVATVDLPAYLVKELININVMHSDLFLANSVVLMWALEVLGRDDTMSKEELQREHKYVCSLSISADLHTPFAQIWLLLRFLFCTYNAHFGLYPGPYQIVICCNDEILHYEPTDHKMPVDVDDAGLAITLLATWMRCLGCGHPKARRCLASRHNLGSLWSFRPVATLQHDPGAAIPQIADSQSSFVLARAGFKKSRELINDYLFSLSDEFVKKNQVRRDLLLAKSVQLPNSVMMSLAKAPAGSVAQVALTRLQQQQHQAALSVVKKKKDEHSEQEHKRVQLLEQGPRERAAAFEGAGVVAAAGGSPSASTVTFGHKAKTKALAEFEDGSMAPSTFEIDDGAP